MLTVNGQDITMASGTGRTLKERFSLEQRMSAPVPPTDHRVHIHCPSCTENMMVSWTWILHKISTAQSMLCPKCGVTLEAIRTITNQEELEWVQLQLAKVESEGPPRSWTE